MKNYLTIDIGGTDIKYGVITNKRELIFKGITPTNTHLGAMSVIEKIKNIFKELNPKYNFEGISISTTGVIDDETNSLLAPPSIPDWNTINFRRDLADLNMKISVENDVNSMALCEQSLIEGSENMKSLFAMTIGTGIGGSIFINGKMHKGHGFSAGECGKMIVNSNGDTFESVAATSALVRMAKEVYPDIDNGIDVFNLFDQGDKKIIDVVNTFYRRLASGMANLIYILNPDHIIIGGGITNRGQRFLDELNAHIEEVLEPYFLKSYTMSIAKNKNDAGMIGAFINFENTFLK
ncbi:MAG TPA: ROK family protein [Acholeplasma sp.]|nr:ROK family protein [Acholeplasma sp.]